VRSLDIECNLRAREIYDQNNKVSVCLSSGLDSQIVLQSFKSQDIPVDYYFLYLEGYNDIEYDQLKLLNKKFNIKTEIIKLDPIVLKDELLDISDRFDSNPNHALQYKFVEQLPGDSTVIQSHTDPWFVSVPTTNKHYIFHSFYDPEIARYEILKQLPRAGKIIPFGDSSEVFLSFIQDSIFDYFLQSWKYFENHKLDLPVYRFDFYIKPLLYAKHWGDNLMYFPKFAGHENIEWMQPVMKKLRKSKMCFAEWYDLKDFLQQCNGETRRLYESPLPRD
jgi:hypothetical protein